jgi:hypothetical protein
MSICLVANGHAWSRVRILAAIQEPNRASSFCLCLWSLSTVAELSQRGSMRLCRSRSILGAAGPVLKTSLTSVWLLCRIASGCASSCWLSTFYKAWSFASFRSQVSRLPARSCYSPGLPLRTEKVSCQQEWPPKRASSLRRPMLRIRS